MKIFGVSIEIGRKEEMTDPSRWVPRKGTAINLGLIFGCTEKRANSYHSCDQ